MAGGGSTGEAGAGSPIARWIAWLVACAVWLFVGASLIGFDPADAPSYAAYPHNAPASNWMGDIGALVAFWSYYTLGLGAWGLVAGVSVLLVLHAAGARVDHPWVRVLGVVLLACAAAGLQALLAPGRSMLADLPGGVVGLVGAAELRAHFNVAGSALWLVLASLVGVLVAYDRWLAPAGGWVLAHTGAAGAWLRGVLARLGRGRRWVGAVLARAIGGLSARRDAGMRANDLDDDERLPAGRRGGAAAGARERQADRGVAAVARGGERAGAAASGAGAEEEEEDPGAPQVFDEERLREKIDQMPVLFARDTRSVATADDLRDLQGVELEGYQFPGLDLLEEPDETFNDTLEDMVRRGAESLERALHQYRIDGEVVGIESGPVITLYDVRLAPGTKVSQLHAVSSDIARALKAVNVRIVANQAGRDTVGVEVPNATKEKVRLKELMGCPDKFQGMKLPMFLGKDASGEPLIADLTRMPHVLIAGTTGSGKSVCMNTIIMSFLYTRKPNELRLVLVDPKMVEMSQFKDIPHLMCPVVTEMSKAAAILEWAVTKMDERYGLLAEAGCRDIAAYNALEWEEIKERFGCESDEEAARIPRRLPYMVFIIDELADLMMTNKEVEGSIVRIAQKARAVGIHLILATQRPQANVVTGLIKGNMPCRISFKVASGLDSRIILDQKGGELLLGQGDMLFLSPATHKLMRCQGTLVDDAETRRVVKFVRGVSGPTYERQIMQLGADGEALSDEDRLLESENNSSASLRRALEDPLFDRAVEIVLETKRGSVSLLQRRLAIGYTRASRLIDLMGIAGIISGHKGSVARDVCVTAEEWAAMKQLAARDAAAEGAQGELFLGDTDANARDGPAASADENHDERHGHPHGDRDDNDHADADADAPFDPDPPRASRARGG